MRTLQLFSACLLLLLSIASCGDSEQTSTQTKAVDPDQEIARIEAAEVKLFDAMGKHSDSLATVVMDGYKQFISDHPDHERTPEFLFRSANIARSYRDYDQAIANYERIVKDYPDYENIVESHFLMAFMYDNDFKDKPKAEEIYKQVAAQYPDHNFASQATERLKTLYLSDEELIKRFKEMNGVE